MKSISRWAVLRCLFAGFVAGLALCSTAQAAFVQGDWDPAYGAPFPDLGWRGSAEFQVSAACLALPNGPSAVGGPCTATSVVAEVEFYDVADVPTTLQTLDFGLGASITDLFLTDGVVTAFRLVSTTRVGSSITQAGSAFFELEIDFDLYGNTEAVLSWFVDGTALEPGGTNGEPALVTVTQIPLPATLGLGLTALALMGALRRRA